MEETERKDLLADMQGAERVNKFLLSEVWLKDLEPMIVEMQQQAQVAAMPQVGVQKTMDEVAINALTNSGKFAAFEDFANRINRIVRDGQEAERRLKKEEKKP